MQASGGGCMVAASLQRGTFMTIRVAGLIAVGLLAAGAETVLTTGRTAAQGLSTPEAAAQAFYAAVEALPVRGVPDAAGLAMLQPLISDDLAGRLAAAEEAEATHAIASNGEAPPLFEGDVFSSLFEGATSYQIDTCTETGAEANCTVSLNRTDLSGTTDWTDTVVLVKVDEAWKVNNIVYGGDWEFATTGTLGELLDGLSASTD